MTVRAFTYPLLGGRDLGFARIAGPGLGNMLFRGHGAWSLRVAMVCGPSGPLGRS